MSLHHREDRPLCRLCKTSPMAPGAEGATDLCDGCWELETRIELQPGLAAEVMEWLGWSVSPPPAPREGESEEYR